MIMRLRLAAGVLLALGAAVAPIGPAAWADPAGLVVEGETTASNSLNKVIKANCPAGKVVTGGGGYLTTSAAAEGHVALYRLEPAADGSGFTASMQEVNAYAGNWILTALAVCAPEPAGYQVVSSVGANQEQYVTTPSCGTGRSVIGMGGKINNGLGQVIIEDVTPSFDLKTVTVRGVEIPGSTDNSWTVTAYAVCANTPAGLERVSLVLPSGSDTQATGVKSCPAGKALYGAGAAMNNGDGNVMLTGVNIAPSSTARAWANEITGGYGSNWNLTVYGICGS